MLDYLGVPEPVDFSTDSWDVIVNAVRTGNTSAYNVGDTKEVWGKEETSNIINYDSAESETRQLDYYKNAGVTTNSGTYSSTYIMMALEV